MANISEILKKADDVEVIAERGGRKIMSFEDQMALATRDNMESMTAKQLGKSDADLGSIKWNPNGTLARTKGDTAAINKEKFYDNRFKKIRNKFYVVIDKIAIDGAAMGRVPYPHLEAFVIGANDDDAVVCEKKVIISDKELVSDYTHKLDEKSMILVLNAIEDYDVEKDTESLAF